IDEANLLNNGMEKTNGDNAEYVFITDQSPNSLKDSYKSKGYDFFLYIPSFDVTNNATKIQLYSQAPIALNQKHNIEKTINNAIELKRLQSANISRDQYRFIHSDISIE